MKRKEWLRTRREIGLASLFTGCTGLIFLGKGLLHFGEFKPSIVYFTVWIYGICAAISSLLALIIFGRRELEEIKLLQDETRPPGDDMGFFEPSQRSRASQIIPWIMLLTPILIIILIALFAKNFHGEESFVYFFVYAPFVAPVMFWAQEKPTDKEAAPYLLGVMLFSIAMLWRILHISFH